jgi:DHA1 family bicyclomycin/chloramphenicol resistance-like MFS transporter
MSRSHLGLALILGSLTAFAPLSIDMYLPAFPAIALALGTDAAGTQRTMAVFFLGMGLGQAFYGPVSDRWGRRLPLFAGLLLYILGAAGCALAGSLDWLTGWRFVQALGGCAGVVVARAVVRDRTEGVESVRLMAMLTLVMGVAPILAPILGNLLLRVADWRAIFWFLAGFGVLMLGMVQLFLPESLPPARRRRDGLPTVLRVYGQLLAEPVLMGNGLAAALSLGGLFAYITGAPFVLMEHFGRTPGQFAWQFGINAMGIIGMSVLSVQLLKLVRPGLLLTGALCFGLAMTLVMLAGAATGLGGFWLVAVTLFLLIASVGVVMPLGMAAAMQPHGRVAGSASALLGTLQFGLGALAGALLGLIPGGGAVPMAAVMALCAAAGLAARLGIRPRRAPAPARI